MKKTGVIIPAGGTGARMGGTPTPKQFMLLGSGGENGKCEPVLARVIRIFRRVASCADIVVALPREHIGTWAALCLEHDIPPHKICEGGASRFLSIKNALRELDPKCEYIAVHDAARPLVSEELILRTLDVARRHGSAIPVVPIADSIRRLVGNGSRPEDRAMLRSVQTPQVFRADILRTAYERAAGDDFTDDASVVESMGYTVMLCEGERRNLKITEPVDLIVAEAILEHDEGRSGTRQGTGQ